MQDFPNIKHRVSSWASGEIGRGSARTGPYPSSPPHPAETPAFPASTITVAVAAPPGQTRADDRGGLVGSRVLQVPGAEAAALGLADCDRLTVASAVLHGADLSSPGRPWITCRTWVARLMEEFKFQAEQVCVRCSVCVFVGCLTVFSRCIFTLCLSLRIPWYNA